MQCIRIQPHHPAIRCTTLERILKSYQRTYVCNLYISQKQLKIIPKKIHIENHQLPKLNSNISKAKANKKTMLITTYYALIIYLSTKMEIRYKLLLHTSNLNYLREMKKQQAVSKSTLNNQFISTSHLEKIKYKIHLQKHKCL